MESDIVTNMPEPTSATSNNKSNMWKYIIIVLILALLGFNLFIYFGQFSKFVGKIIDYIVNLFKPLLAYFGYGVSEATKKTINVTADTLTGGINALEKGLKPQKPNVLKKATQAQKKREQQKEQYPLPDEAGSVTQSKGTRKAGFCYIGEDRGFRSCISVGEGDECMSGDIFPTREQCINPNLRSG